MQRAFPVGFEREGAVSSTTTPQAGAVCSLDADGLSSRLIHIALLAQRYLRSDRQEGRTLHLSYAKEAGPELRSILELERQCCPFLVFDLKEEDAAIKLAILAPDTDGFRASLYDHFRGTAVSKPSRGCAGSGCGCAA